MTCQSSKMLLIYINEFDLLLHFLPQGLNSLFQQLLATLELVDSQIHLTDRRHAALSCLTELHQLDRRRFNAECCTENKLNTHDFVIGAAMLCTFSSSWSETVTCFSLWSWSSARHSVVSSGQIWEEKERSSWNKSRERPARGELRYAAISAAAFSCNTQEN